jgi:hypothetical protein
MFVVTSKPQRPAVWLALTLTIYMTAYSEPTATVSVRDEIDKLLDSDMSE